MISKASVHTPRAPASRGGPLRLKAERIQRFLVEHPSWELTREGRTLVRRFAMISPHAAAAFVGWVIQTAEGFGVSPTIETRGGEVAILIAAQNRSLTARDLDFARALSLERSAIPRAA